jgi:hypothetical protein
MGKTAFTGATTHFSCRAYVQLRANFEVTTRIYAQNSQKIRALTHIFAKNCTRKYAEPLKSE